jgi:gluconate kinase
VLDARTYEYRRNAEKCRLQAGKSCHDADKAAWLKMAEEWQLLAEGTEAKFREGLQKNDAKLVGCSSSHSQSLLKPAQ